jgi:hypothetical protein
MPQKFTPRRPPKGGGRTRNLVEIQIGDDAIFALIQVKYSEKAEAGQPGRANSWRPRPAPAARFPEGRTAFFATPKTFAARKNRCATDPSTAAEVNGKNRRGARSGDARAG